jgi:hypothetical protein
MPVDFRSNQYCQQNQQYALTKPFIKEPLIPLQKRMFLDVP